MLLACYISPNYAETSSEEVQREWDSNCDGHEIKVPSDYGCETAEPDDVTQADVAFSTWHEGSDRYFRIEERKQCYIEANRTCELHGGTLVNVDSTALAWIAENLGDGWYWLWTTYRAADKGTIKSFRRTCVFEPSTGREPAISFVLDECNQCECVHAMITIESGVPNKEYLRRHCDTPVSVLCEKAYD